MPFKREDVQIVEQLNSSLESATTVFFHRGRPLRLSPVVDHHQTSGLTKSARTSGKLIVVRVREPSSFMLCTAEIGLPRGTLMRFFIFSYLVRFNTIRALASSQHPLTSLRRSNTASQTVSYNLPAFPFPPSRTPHRHMGDVDCRHTLNRRVPIPNNLGSITVVSNT